MPIARAMPRKYLTVLDEAQEQLRLLGQRAQLALQEVETGRSPYRQLPVLLRDIETSAYKVAFELSQIEVAGDCDECPAAPAMTSAQIHLYVLADELDRQAMLAREKANSISGQRIELYRMPINTTHTCHVNGGDATK